MPSIPNCTVCAPTAPDANPYINPPTKLDTIYQYAIEYSTTVFNGNKTNAHYHALTLLKEQVRRWSSFQDIPVNNGPRIVWGTLTYLDPELLQFIILNVLLSQALPISIDEVKSKLTNGLQDIAKRDERIFLVTVTTSQYDSNAFGENLVTIKLPIYKMQMINCSNVAPTPRHDDHLLEQTINISHKRMSGYLAYPIAVQMGENCHQIMASQWNTLMVINLDSVEINGEAYNHQLNWTMKYHPLINLDNSSVPSPPPIPAGFVQARLSYSTTPPPPEIGRLPNDDSYRNTY